MSATYELTVAPNGARKTKADHPALPMTTEELAICARDCQIAGAGAIHLHVRDRQGAHSLDAGRYRDAISAIQDLAPGMGVQITTESAGLFDVDAQYECVRALRPASASISVREMARDEDVAARVYALAHEANTRVQHILYDASCLTRFRDWRARGIIRATQDDVLFVLGQYVPPVPARPTDLDLFLSELSEETVNWTVCAFGQAEQASLLWAIHRGGNARVGFENNMVSTTGNVHSNNSAAVQSLVTAANSLGYMPAHLARPIAA